MGAGESELSPLLSLPADLLWAIFSKLQLSPAAFNACSFLRSMPIAPVGEHTSAPFAHWAGMAKQVTLKVTWSEQSHCQVAHLRSRGPFNEAGFKSAATVVCQLFSGVSIHTMLNGTDWDDDPTPRCASDVTYDVQWLVDALAACAASPALSRFIACLT